VYFVWFSWFVSRLISVGGSNSIRGYHFSCSLRFTLVDVLQSSTIKMSTQKSSDATKVCIAGPEHVGKTAMLIRFLNGEFLEEDDPTIEDSHNRTISVDNREWKLWFHDTGGNPSYDHLHEKWFSWADAFILCFSVCSTYSFEQLCDLIKEISKIRKDNDFPLVIVGTQNDLERTVSLEKAFELAHNVGCSYIETSAKTGANISQVFREVVREVRIYKKESEALANSESAAGKKPKKERGGVLRLLSGKGPVKRDEDVFELVDNALSILKDPVRRKEMYEAVPELPVRSLKTKMEIASIAGPSRDCFQHAFKDLVMAKSVSAYPQKVLQGTTNSDGSPILLEVREGDPICDQYALLAFENRVMVAVADGCNWGEEPRLAAEKASYIFIDYLKKHQKDISDLRDTVPLILRAFMAAHNTIIDGYSMDNIYQAGTTTMIAGMCFELLSPYQGFSHAFVFVSLGDCKAYHLRMRSGDITDLTDDNRNNILDAKDPGGRIGPHLEGGQPDLRNLSVFWVPCDAEDILFLTTDGVHDNLDPQHLGKLPSELNLTIPNDSWSSLDPQKDPGTYEQARKAKSAFIKSFINNLIGVENPVTQVNRPTPALLTERLITHCLSTTESSRSFMEKNYGKKLPPDFKQYPGKMDHVTCCAFRAGMLCPAIERTIEPIATSSSEVLNFPLKTPKEASAPSPNPIPTSNSSPSPIPNPIPNPSPNPIPNPSSKLNSEGNSTVPNRKDPLSSGWLECYTPTHQIYFYNIHTKESCWEDPFLNGGNNARLDWRAYYTDDNTHIYYYNLKTNETVWDPPNGWDKSCKAAVLPQASAKVKYPLPSGRSNDSSNRRIVAPDAAAQVKETNPIVFCSSILAITPSIPFNELPWMADAGWPISHSLLTVAIHNDTDTPIHTFSLGILNEKKLVWGRAPRDGPFFLEDLLERTREVYDRIQCAKSAQWKPYPGDIFQCLHPPQPISVDNDQYRDTTFGGLFY